jgi:hypothetical protein
MKRRLITLAGHKQLAASKSPKPYAPSKVWVDEAAQVCERKCTGSNTVAKKIGYLIARPHSAIPTQALNRSRVYLRFRNLVMANQITRVRYRLLQCRQLPMRPAASAHSEPAVSISRRSRFAHMGDDVPDVSFDLATLNLKVFERQVLGPHRIPISLPAAMPDQ